MDNSKKSMTNSITTMRLLHILLSSMTCLCSRGKVPLRYDSSGCLPCSALSASLHVCSSTVQWRDVFQLGRLGLRKNIISGLHYHIEWFFYLKVPRCDLVQGNTYINFRLILSYPLVYTIVISGVEFPREGYKIRKVFGYKSIFQKETVEFCKSM